MLLILIGCSGWSYADSFGKGGWTIFLSMMQKTKKLQYYSQFFDTAEMDATFYEKFYKYKDKRDIYCDDQRPKQLQIIFSFQLKFLRQ
jgi:uncharacterized protein YecE (DUF72 family)